MCKKQGLIIVILHRKNINFYYERDIDNTYILIYYTFVLRIGTKSLIFQKKHVNRLTYVNG